MGIIALIVFGLIAGVIAKFLMPGRDGGGFFLTCILGIVGAVVGGWLATTWRAAWTPWPRAARCGRPWMRCTANATARRRRIGA